MTLIEMQNLLEDIGKRVQKASKILATLDTDKKNQALIQIANLLEKKQAEILKRQSNRYTKWKRKKSF